MGYQRDERRYARGDDVYDRPRGYGREFGRNDEDGGWRDERGRDFDERERNVFDRLADELRSWFGDEQAERRRRIDEREGAWRDRERQGHREFGAPHDRDFGGPDRARNAEFRGYGNWGGGGRNRTQPYGQGWEDRHHDPHYRSWRDRQMEAFDREYADYWHENQSRFDSDFGSWRRQREARRGHIANIQEHAEVLSSDGQHVGTVDKVSGERIILTRSDPEAGGHHHWIPTSWVANVDGDKVRLSRTHDDAQRHWHETANDDGSGPHILGRSFAGTY
jgi:hypothetical protein